MKNNTPDPYTSKPDSPRAHVLMRQALNKMVELEKDGGRYNSETCAQKIDTGLVAGDSCASGPLRLAYSGDGNITVTEDGNDVPNYEGPASPEQLDMMLVLVAIKAARMGTLSQG